jgi:Outer membrane protein
MKKYVSTLFFGALVALFVANPISSTAQDLNVGFVEPRFILERMPEMAAVQQRLQNFVDRKSQELADQEAEFQSQIQSYQERSAVMSDQARANEEERLGALSAELQQAQAVAEQEVNQRRAELMAPLLEQVQQAIDEVAAERGFDVVLNTTTSTGDVIILYVAENLREQNDITDAVMEKLDMDM